MSDETEWHESLSGNRSAYRQPHRDLLLCSMSFFARLTDSIPPVFFGSLPNRIFPASFVLFFPPKVFFQSKAFCWSIGIFFIDDMSYDLRLKLYLFVFPSFVCAPFRQDHHQKLLAPSQPSVRSTTRSFKFQVDFSPSRFLFAFFSLVEFSTTNAFLRVYGLSEDERKRERNKTKP